VARLAFLGSPPAAAVALGALAAAGHDIVLVVSRADTRRGRGGATSPSPVKQVALDLGLPVTDRLADVTGAGAELGVVVAYGRIIPGAVLGALPMVNAHFSLLPRWRGAAPVERAILAGDAGTGVCLMRLDEGLDTGPVLSARSLAIGPREHASSLTGRLATVAADLLVEALAGGVGALGPGTPQAGEPTYAAKLTPAELRLDWDRPATELERVVRLDRAWTTLGGQRLLVLEARALPGDGPPSPGAPTVPAGPPGTLDGTAVVTGHGVLELEVVQPSGRRPMAAAEWRRGLRAASGLRLGDGGAAR
jgi:methionyl-tRNA formyltransferase